MWGSPSPGWPRPWPPFSAWLVLRLEYAQQRQTTMTLPLASGRKSRASGLDAVDRAHATLSVCEKRSKGRQRVVRVLVLKAPSVVLTPKQEERFTVRASCSDWRPTRRPRLSLRGVRWPWTRGRMVLRWPFSAGSTESASFCRPKISPFSVNKRLSFSSERLVWFPYVLLHSVLSVRSVLWRLDRGVYAFGVTMPLANESLNFFFLLRCSQQLSGDAGTDDELENLRVLCSMFSVWFAFKKKKKKQRQWQNWMLLNSVRRAETDEQRVKRRRIALGRFGCVARVRGKTERKCYGRRFMFCAQGVVGLDTIHAGCPACFRPLGRPPCCQNTCYGRS